MVNKFNLDPTLFNHQTSGSSLSLNSHIEDLRLGESILHLDQKDSYSFMYN